MVHDVHIPLPYKAENKVKKKGSTIPQNISSRQYISKLSKKSSIKVSFEDFWNDIIDLKYLNVIAELHYCKEQLL